MTASETETTEQWKSIPGYEGRYEASDHGNVRSLGFSIRNPWGTQTWKPGRTLKPTPHPQGYRMVTLTDEFGKRRTTKAPRLVLLAFVGQPPPGKSDVLHWDDDPAHDHLRNLRWGDQSENSLDSVRNGVHPMASRLQCPLDHLLVEPNLTSSTIQRRCLACSLATNNRLQDEKAKARGCPRVSYHRGRDGFLRRAGESQTEEAHRRYAHIMRDQVGGA